MNPKEATVFLFTIAREIKRSLEHPVILFTMTDYANSIFDSLVEMRSALMQHAMPGRLMDIVYNFHLYWLEAVKDIEFFRNKIKDTPREVIYNAIDFTIDCVANRRKYFQKYIDQLQITMTAEESQIMQADLEIMDEIIESLISVLQDKSKSLRSHADHSDYYFKVKDEIEELLNWLDNLNNNLAVQFSKIVELKFPDLVSDLTKTLYDIADEIAASTDEDTQTLLKKMLCKRQHWNCALRLHPADEIEMRKIVEKIQVLESRIDRLKSQNSSAVMALQHKTMYLEDRLTSLENLKTSLYTLKCKRMEDFRTQDMSKRQEIHMFEHLLPPTTRCHLVNQLTRLWNDAISGNQETKSIISILSAADIKEVFSDELGKFTVDKHGRKIYRISAFDDNLYQLNDNNQLVALKDDEKHVYFYDDCGRYYLSQNQRIYKAHADASEYLISHEGRMLKYKETKYGVDYMYDNLGRYYIDKQGKKIYSDEGSTEKYEHDGLGNLVRIRDDEIEYKTCPREPMVTEDSKYLQCTVGTALKRCLADVVLHQPLDPILYLANRLEKYRHNMKEKQNRQQAELEMGDHRKLQMNIDQLFKTSYVSLSCEDADYNFVNYQTVAP